MYLSTAYEFVEVPKIKEFHANFFFYSFLMYVLDPGGKY